jgi:hypothetical protein
VTPDANASPAEVVNPADTPARVSTKPVFLEWLVEHRNVDRAAMAKLTKDELWQHIEPTEELHHSTIRPNQQRDRNVETVVAQRHPTPRKYRGWGCESEMTYVTTFFTHG